VISVLKVPPIVVLPPGEYKVQYSCYLLMVVNCGPWIRIQSPDFLQNLITFCLVHAQFLYNMSS